MLEEGKGESSGKAASRRYKASEGFVHGEGDFRDGDTGVYHSRKEDQADMVDPWSDVLLTLYDEIMGERE